MLTKKNYKQQQHFTQHFTFSIIAPRSGTEPPRKYQVYFKRYKRQQDSQNLYNIIYGTQKKQDDTEKNNVSKFSQDRTLELISFDGNIGFVKSYLRKIGKIRLFETGEGIYKGHKIFTAMCVFKFQFDLVKCFRDEYLQTIINEQTLSVSKTLTQEDRQSQRYDLIKNHLGDEIQKNVDKIKQLQKGGYNVVTNIHGQYRFDYESNQKFVENLPQLKKQKKRQEKEKRLRELKQKQEQEEKQKQEV